MKSYNISEISQRQLRVGEMIKQALSLLFIKGEAKIPNLETNLITVTEVRMSQDLKVARVFVLPLGGKDSKKTVDLLKEFSYIVRKSLSKKIEMKYLPRVSFVEDKSFEYAEKIESLIKQTNK
jgi:ribosome-binding factor A|tara:strand:- start:707 stop:1075 length:369 start_codon:yes stop_codon:yes gene_type:complete